MALTGLTKIGGSSLEDPLLLAGDFRVAGVSTFVDTIFGKAGIELQAIGIQSGGQFIAGDTSTTPVQTLNFIGAGNTFSYHNNVCDISIAGGGGGGGGVAVEDSVGKVAFIHYGGWSSNASVKSPQKFGEVFTHVDAAVDIEDGVTVDIDDECLLLITDKDDYDINFFAPTDPYEMLYPQTNPLRSGGFDDTIRTTFDTDGVLDATKKVGYVKLPKHLEDEIPIDIETGITVSIGDQCVLII